MSVWIKIRDDLLLSLFKRYSKKRKEKNMEEFTGFKDYLTSKTIWGIIISIMASIFSKYGYTISESLQGEIVEAVLSLISVISGFYGIYGRFKATKKLT